MTVGPPAIEDVLGQTRHERMRSGEEDLAGLHCTIEPGVNALHPDGVAQARWRFA